MLKEYGPIYAKGMYSGPKKADAQTGGGTVVQMALELGGARWDKQPPMPTVPPTQPWCGQPGPMRQPRKVHRYAPYDMETTLSWTEMQLHLAKKRGVQPN